MTSPRSIFSTPIVHFPSVGIKTYIEADLHVLCMRAVLEDELKRAKDFVRWLEVKKDLNHLHRLELGLHDLEDYM